MHNIREWLSSPRNSKITNSYGVYDAYKYIRKNKWFNIERPLTEKEFYSIIREINNNLIEEFLGGNDIKLPYRLGKIELRKRTSKIEFRGGKIKTNLPIDWKNTLELWTEDKEAYTNKILVRLEEKEVYKILYNKSNAIYNNKAFFTITFNRELKRKLKDKIKNNEIDSFKLYG